MIWLTWRQFRAQAAAMVVPLAAFAAVLAITGTQLRDEYDRDGADFLPQLSGANSSLYLIGALAVMVVPAIIGMFWGAPLITRELDAGTHRLVWSQSVTRICWLVIKLGLTGLAAMTVAGILSLAVAWWASPIDTAADATSVLAGFYFPRLSPVIFDARGVAPLGHAAFAFIVGVTMGVLVRRTLPAMILSLAVFLAVQIAMPIWVRPALVTPEQVTTPITAENLRRWDGERVHLTLDQPGAWVTAQQTVNAAGQPVAAPSWVTDCLGQGAAQRACVNKLDQLGYQQLVSYQPADRFWTIQWLELAIYLALAAALAGFCAWLLLRKERI
ncbi:ABC transporter permease subunit [Actinopolymorpha alba]|uniref:ABC transporter permease subunit n=1 Tax=Actinopolymorpha alba TaxID=533267 RepID=UPI00036AC91F|nr:ABC transporter permease subunit [Actinopolymorpha alba]